eukprot:COSAG02_NODE_12124_length_1592_cov_1.689886_1_plen_340_part_00
MLRLAAVGLSDSLPEAEPQVDGTRSMDLELALASFVQSVRDGRSAKLPDDPTELGQRARVFTAPGLHAAPFWPVPAAVQTLAADAICDIRRELLQLMRTRPASTQRHGRDVYEPLKLRDSTGHDMGLIFDPNDGWRSVDFSQDGRWNQEQCASCPCTMDFLRSLPLCECTLARAYVSILTAHKSIAPHHGRSNIKLRMQLPVIMGSEAAGFSEIRVGGVPCRYEEGQPILFDDTFLHEVRNCSTVDRVVLLFDIWHPQLTAAEIDRISGVFSPVQPPVRADVALLNAAPDSSTGHQHAHAAEQSQSEAQPAMEEELHSVLHEVDHLKRELGMLPAGQVE